MILFAFRRRWLPLVVLVLAVQTMPAAQASPAVPASAPSTFELKGPTLRGEPFELARQRGRVVMVVYWATDCAVCRDKLPELRQNLAGWAAKPFDLVLVNVNAKESDWRRYEQLLALTHPQSVQRAVALWAGAPGFRHSLSAKPAQLPLTLVFDPSGTERLRVAGRVPAEAWDTVAEWLP